MPNLVNAGSVEDIRCTIKLVGEKYSDKQILDDISWEKDHHNRKTVIKMLYSLLHRNQKDAAKPS